MSPENLLEFLKANNNGSYLEQELSSWGEEVGGGLLTEKFTTLCLTVFIDWLT